MTPLGKPLVFYLRYMAEMERLYCDLEEGEERDLTGIDNAEEVLEMARNVGDTATNHVVDFLELCGKGIENHFSGLGIATLANKKKRAYIADYWEWQTRIDVPSLPGGWFSVGAFVSAPPGVRISLAKGVSGMVVPWLWSKGGRKGADAIWKILAGQAHSRGDGVDGYKGTVLLSCIPIKAQPPESFDVDRDPLIADVAKTIARIGAVETKAIASFVAGLKGSDEG